MCSFSSSLSHLSEPTTAVSFFPVRLWKRHRAATSQNARLYLLYISWTAETCKKVKKGFTNITHLVLEVFLVFVWLYSERRRQRCFTLDLCRKTICSCPALWLVLIFYEKSLPPFPIVPSLPVSSTDRCALLSFLLSLGTKSRWVDLWRV